MKMKEKRAFTLIELLVVIAIIALLLSIIVPSLRLVKQLATGAVCLANEKNLGLAWVQYYTENDGHLVGGNPWPETEFAPIAWVKCPQDENGTTYPEDIPEFEYKMIGIRRGLLWAYMDTEKAYHCPGDRRIHDPLQEAYRSYSIIWTINGSYGISYETDPIYDIGEVAHKHGEIKSPGNKLVFVEDQDDRGWNMGSWVVNPYGNNWTDALGLWHVDSGTLAFADGHAEKHKWRDQRTIDYFADPYDGGGGGSGGPNVDLKYIQRAFLPTGRGPGEH